MNPLRFAMIGAGFWSQYQLAAWQELKDAQCVAVVDCELSKAESLADRFGVPNAYSHAEELVDREDLDFIDVVTDVDSHPVLASLGTRHQLPVICQKPMGSSLEVARSMVSASSAAHVPLLIHENWRWQRPIRRLKQILESGQLGSVVRARIDYANSFPVFTNQPFLKELDQFILSDVGTHILDTARFLFGEASTLYCQTRRMHPDIAGEDVATVVMQMGQGVTVTCNMSYASHWEFDQFPQTMVAVEGTRAGVTLGNDFKITVYGDEEPVTEVCAPIAYDWADPDYALLHSSIVDCHRHLLGALRGKWEAETTGDDNLRTLELVFGAYQSSAQRVVMSLEGNQE